MDIIIPILLSLVMGVGFYLIFYPIFKAFAEDVKWEADYWRKQGKEPTPLPPGLNFIFKDCQKEDETKHD